MVEGTLWIRRAVCGAVMGLLALGVASCREDEKPIGMTLLFQSAGMPVGVLRFDPDGMRGPVPGAVSGMSPRFGKQMTFMPRDSKHGAPRFVDVEWTVTTPALNAWWKENISNRADKYSEKWNKDYQEAMKRVPRHSRRIDLSRIISAELIEKVRADHPNTQLKLTVTFNNDEVDIKAEAYKWR